MHKTFKVNQHALIKNSAGEIFVLEQDGKWMLPGGRIEESDKDAREGLIRELKEETGLQDLKVADIVDVVISPSGKTFNVIYGVLANGNPEVRISSEHTDYAWVRADNIDKYQFHVETNKQRILDYISR